MNGRAVDKARRAINLLISGGMVGRDVPASQSVMTFTFHWRKSFRKLSTNNTTTTAHISAATRVMSIQHKHTYNNVFL